MKYLILMLCFSVGFVSHAQKKELKKIDKAIAANELDKALEIFNSINESEVEEKYEGKYFYYNAAVILGVIGDNEASLSDVEKAKMLIKKSQSAGYENEQMTPVIESVIQSRMIDIVNEKLTAGKTEDAVEIVEQIYAENPDDKDMLFTSAQLSYQVSDFNTAIEKFQELLDFGYTGQKTNYFATNVSTEVEESFPSQKLMDISVDKAKTHIEPRVEMTSSKIGVVVNNLVWLYKNDDQLDKAKFVFEKSLDRFPDDESLQVVTPEIYNTLGMIEEYKKAMSSEDSRITDPKVYNNLAEAAMRSKDYDNAIKYYTSSLELEEDNFFSNVNLSNAYLQKGNLEETTAKEQQELYKKAITHLERALEIKPDNKEILPTLVSLYGVFEMTDKAEAIKAKM